MLNWFEQTVKELLDKKGSDLHVVPNEKVSFRIDGKIIKTSRETNETETKRLLELLQQKIGVASANLVKEKLEKHGNAGFSITLQDQRFRVNVSRVANGYQIVLRHIKEIPPHIDELGFLPKTIQGLKELINRPAGLFLVTGGTGSGKSTTLASIIREINEKFNKKIITLEDPIEYVHKSINCLVVQRELGRDFPRFSDGLHSALREDPDVILVGEIRDEASLELCLKASETGHLVFATLHTNDAVSTVKRIVAMSSNQTLTRDRLSQSLLGVLSQRLALKKDGAGRVLIYEFLFANKGVLAQIRESKDEQIYSMIDSIPYSNSFNVNIIERYKQGLISKETAIAVSPDPSKLDLDNTEVSYSSPLESDNGGGMRKVVI